MYEQLVSVEKNLAHAYVLVGERESVYQDLVRWLEESQGIAVATNPNVMTTRTTRFSIAMARELQEKQSKTSVGVGTGNVFIIAFDSITHEAQNALLKVIEEPTRETLLFFITASPETLLSTVRSRVQVLQSEHSALLNDIGFLSMNYASRIEFCSTMYGDSAKDIPPRRGELAQVIDTVLHELITHKAQVPEWTKRYREVERLRRYVMDRSSSVKYICEYMSVTLPMI